MITGKMMKDAIISASNNVSVHRQEIDALNVFPVPDGDTGTNMSMTLSAASREVSLLPDSSTVSEVINCAASALLRGARGNSGVILSLIFRGFAKGFKGLEAAEAKDVANALVCGKEAAYKAVMKPTEGTILTVVRISSEKAVKALEEGKDTRELCLVAYRAAKQALADTPNMLPVLKTAGVVDAGGQGFVYALQGMKRALIDNAPIMAAENPSDSGESKSGAVRAAANEAGENIKFTYCTEFIVNKDAECNLEATELRKYLESIGDCVVVVDDEDIIKVHVHSNEPGNILQKALLYGQLVSIKIENMREQHQNALWGAAPEAKGEPELPISAAVEKQYGIVAVASGSGIEEMFREIGVDQIITGGQTMNPSTDDILKAVAATPAEHVFILPNNKNIIMAAEQVAPLTDKGVSVLHTKTIPQGITAALSFDESMSPEENHLMMMKAAEAVNTGLVTFAARDSVIEGQKVRKGEILGMENGKINVIGTDVVDVAYKVTRHLFRKKPASLITVFYGNGTGEDKAEQLAEMLRTKYGSEADVSVVNGGQPVYYFIISVE